MRGATICPRCEFWVVFISIHAPHARSDASRPGRAGTSTYFNPRSSCEERRSRGGPWRGLSAFQSTLLMRGATRAGGNPATCKRISIHAPHARSDLHGISKSKSKRHFNPRSSCEERRPTGICCRPTRYFNPRSSCEERRAHDPVILALKTISIHAPHARSDISGVLLARFFAYFNPRSSCEERHHLPSAHVSTLAFQSTLLMRGATTPFALGVDGSVFQSTLLMRGATLRQAVKTRQLQFQSTLLMRGATRWHATWSMLSRYFNPRSSCEERHRHQCYHGRGRQISIHAPHARSDVRLYE